jgi:site-specific recombinase XerD
VNFSDPEIRFSLMKPPVTPIRLGLHHFAYLRAVANGLSVVDCAKRYLGVQHGNAARKEHARLVSVTRALAQRRGDHRWRLLGLEIGGFHQKGGKDGASVVQQGVAPLAKSLPTLDDWSAREGYDDFSQEDRVRFYTDAFGVDPTVEPDATVSTGQIAPGSPLSLTPLQLRKQQRNARLLQKRLDLLLHLQQEVAVQPQPTDLLAGWLPEPLVVSLTNLGDATLGDLARRIGRGGRWWTVLPAYGPRKAKALEQLLLILLPALEHQPRVDWAAVAGMPVVTRMKDGVSPQQALVLSPSGLAVSSGSSFSSSSALSSGSSSTSTPSSSLSPSIALTSASNDRDAVEAWLNARASHSVATRIGYTREAERFLMWLRMERQKDLRGARVEDCMAYMRFIDDVPDAWISRRRAARFATGWAPFRGPLTKASQRLCLDTLHSLFTWLQKSGYLRGNPWLLIDTRMEDDRKEEGDYGSRAFTPAAWKVLMQALALPSGAEPSDAERSGAGHSAMVKPMSVARMRWICVFVHSVGLRSTELLTLTRGDFKELPKGWVVKVEGKGRKRRSIPVPNSAMEATRAYFAEKGVVFDGAPAHTPMLSALKDVSARISYQALYMSFTAFVRRTIRNSNLSATEKSQAVRASAHWLRHTYATRSAERGMPLDILQENMGQSDPRVTARYYRAQMERRQAEVERVFGVG